MRALVAVLIGGAIGTVLRLGLDDLIVHHDNQFPWSTLIANVTGSFLLAILVSRVWPVAPDWVKAGLGPGLLGGYTTFSAAMASMVTLAASGDIPTALLYIVVSLILGFGAAALGFWIALPRTSAPVIEADE
jgi:fluoride exporter